MNVKWTLEVSFNVESRGMGEGYKDVINRYLSNIVVINGYLITRGIL